MLNIVFNCIPVGLIISGGGSSSNSSSDSLSSELVAGVICFDACGVVDVLSAAAVSTCAAPVVVPSVPSLSVSSFEIDSIS